MIIISHKVCSGPALETNSLESESCAILENDFPFTCFTCLDDILDQSELRVSEEVRM
ncbi:MAG: hypothetical protein HY282_04845 [Nitrospirae bacterium]|nr:hypothetical protein [Candidatus Manganitrophaceae bacterium]